MHEPPGPPLRRERGSIRFAAIPRDAGLLVALVAVVLGFGLTTEHYLSLANLRTVANQIPPLAIVATGMTFVLVAGGIDLSVGSAMALAGAVAGAAMTRGEAPVAVALALAPLAGLACGALNAALAAGGRIPAFIVTLGTLEIARGATYLATNSRTEYLGRSVGRLAEGGIGGLAPPFLVAATVAALGHLALERTVFGRHAMATGANPDAARHSGISVTRVRAIAFLVSGGLAGVAAIAHMARLSSADPNAGIGLELQAIAAAVIGGTSLSGGRGSVARTMLGVLVMAALGSGLVHANAGDPVRRVVTGAVIVAAVALDALRPSGGAPR